MSLVNLPLMVELKEKNVVVIGGGKVAERRIQKLLEVKAIVKVISPKLTEKLRLLVMQNKIEWLEKSFSREDLNGAFFVIAATNDSAINQQVANATSTQMLLNVVDNPALGNIQFPTYIQRGKLTIAVTTNGASPKLAKKIKQQLSETYDQRYESYLDFLFECREMIKQINIPIEEKGKLLEELLSDDLLDSNKQQQYLVWLTSKFNDFID